MDYVCDICGSRIQKTSGYSYTTTQVATSTGYWKKLFEGDPSTYGGDGSAVAMAAMIMIVHGTPWIVCEPCSMLVEGDAEAARRYAASDQAPPGCGPADRQEATLAAAYAWSLTYDEWPTSVQIGQNPITHDSTQGTRCDFCRRILYGDEKFGMFGEQAYQDLLNKGARFVRNPMPEHVVKGERYWIACMTCLERPTSNAANAVPAAAAAAGRARENRRWWKFW